jgi:hypothetical protein
MEFLIVAALLGLIPGAIASKKGRSFGLWWFFGAMLFIVALPMAILMKPKDAEVAASPSGKVRPDNHVPGWLVIVALIGVGFFIYMQAGGGGSSSGSSFSLQPVVTMAEYQQLQNGMSYQQVVQVIGQPGEEASRNHMDGVPGVMESVETVMYQWINPGGSNMNAMFQNDKLIQKAQFGLR